MRGSTVDVSDALAVNNVIREASMSVCLEPLPVTEAKIRHVCIVKMNYESVIYGNGVTVSLLTVYFLSLHSFVLSLIRL